MHIFAAYVGLIVLLLGGIIFALAFQDWRKATTDISFQDALEFPMTKHERVQMVTGAILMIGGHLAIIINLIILNI